MMTPLLCLCILLGTSLPGRTITWLPEAVRLDVGIPDWPYASSDPRIAVSGDRVFAVWRTYRYHGDPDDLPETDVYFSASFNGGLSWMAAPAKLNTALPKGYITNPRLACSGENVFVAWMETKAGTYAVYFNRSRDGGLTWLDTPVRVNHGHRGASDPRIACSDGCLVLAWFSQADLFAERSLDAGETWLGRNIRIDTGDPRGSAYSRSHEVGCRGGRVFAVWSDGRNSHYKQNVYYNGSWDGGETWLSSAIPLESDISTGIVGLKPHLAISCDRIAVVWSDGYHVIPGIRMNLSRDGGLSWTGEKKVCPMNAWSLQTTAEDHAFHVAYHVKYTGEGNWGVWHFRILEPEGTWTEPRRISAASEDYPEFRDPVICASGNRVYIAWGYTPDDSDQHMDVHMNLSTDHGRTWLETPVRLDTGDPPGAHGSSSPQIACSGKRVHAVWGDMRPGLQGIFYNTGLVEVPTAALTISAGPGGATFPPPGQFAYEQGTDVMLTAEPDALYEFIGWSGDVVSADPTIRLELERDTAVTAEFARIIHAPLDLTAEARVNRSFLFRETVHALKWHANPLNVDIARYRIYRRQGGSRTLLGEAAAGVNRFLCRNAPPGISVTYEVAAVDANGREGAPAVVSL